jgi:hypothetical protein
MSNPEYGPGLPEIEHDYAAIKWRHVPGILAAIHDELRELRDSRQQIHIRGQVDLGVYREVARRTKGGRS